ncbi:MAG: hypothetical protein IJO64_04360 [Clostridia bacterium]|nr:hypothetical protein [Clostridia bacterium]MBQ9848273.1 hypothetical protein [Clostridia bacterium]
MQNNCAICAKPLENDDIGATKKLINRGMTEGFLCKACLAKRFGVSEGVINEKIEYWRESGCLLFAKKQ